MDCRGYFQLVFYFLFRLNSNKTTNMLRCTACGRHVNFLRFVFILTIQFLFLFSLSLYATSLTLFFASFFLVARKDSIHMWRNLLNICFYFHFQSGNVQFSNNRSNKHTCTLHIHSLFSENDRFVFIGNENKNKNAPEFVEMEPSYTSIFIFYYFHIHF